MYKICVFAGTTEGRRLIEFLSGRQVEVTACVATEYGEALLPAAENVNISAKRLSENEILALLSDIPFDMVIDATHPYAAAVTESVFNACKAANVEYLRLLRENSVEAADAFYFPDTASAVEFLSGVGGNILLTTGSKELAEFAAITDFSERVYARVLPMEDSLRLCREAGIKPAHIIAAQGPFSTEMNTAMLKFVSAEWLVTKDGGRAGGFDEKLAAVRAAGAKAVVIGRPPQKSGVSFSEAAALLNERFKFERRVVVDIIGVGAGGVGTMTREAEQAIAKADCLIGAKRMLESVNSGSRQLYTAVLPENIAEFIRCHSEYERFAVIMSGDTGFFSGAKKLIPLLDGCDVKVLPGISSLSYFCAGLKTSYEDIFTASIHGRRRDIVSDIRAHRRVFLLTGGENSINRICADLLAAGLDKVKISVGERLSYSDEKITVGTAVDLADKKFEPLSVVLLENDCPDKIISCGLPDSAFLRNTSAENPVPMTKSEVRAICLSKLRLTEFSTCWDIGAGTGSVAVEMAMLAKSGQVYAIERKKEAIELILRNKELFSAENLTVISGSAPESCVTLPIPTHVFIGGSGGNMREIISLLLSKNPAVRIVATAISLESTAELTACLREFAFCETEVISVQVSRGKKAGGYHLMSANNPIYIFTMQGGAK